MKTSKELAKDFDSPEKWMKGSPEEWVQNTFLAGFEAAKDNLTTTELHLALRMCGISIDIQTVDKIIDLCELIMDKSDQTTIKDVEDLKLEWQSRRV